jgi:hypothetical protein
MDALSVAAFEQRASAAEERLLVLEAKLAGASKSSPAATEELTELRVILVQARIENPLHVLNW